MTVGYCITTPNLPQPHALWTVLICFRFESGIGQTAASSSGIQYIAGCGTTLPLPLMKRLPLAPLRRGFSFVAALVGGLVYLPVPLTKSKPNNDSCAGLFSINLPFKF